MLAPHPFYQERGSPIAVKLLLSVLSKRGDSVHVVVFHEGQEVQMPNIQLHRAPAPFFVRNVPPGFSWKKVLCDISMCFTAMRLARRGRFEVVYAVEESVFIALLLKWIGRIPYVYDMDSRLSQQLAETHRLFAIVRPMLQFFERVAIRNACMIVPVCDGLVTPNEVAEGQKVVLLRDVSLLPGTDVDGDGKRMLRTEAEIPSARIIMYVGNLQPYQGIGFLLDSFAIAAERQQDVDLVVIGGSAADIASYREYAEQIGIASRVHFLGPRPVNNLRHYLAAADVLVSPRIKGGNTPMKLYSYLHSGTPCVLTNLRTHTQVADESIAVLSDPEPVAFSEGMLRVLQDEGLGRRLGAAARQFIEENHSLTGFSDSAHELFEWLDSRLVAGRSEE